MLFANMRPRIRLNSVIHVRRSLVGKGEISAKVGMEVTPDDILGISLQDAGFVAVKLAPLLSVSPSEASKFLQKRLGDSIYRGELLALRTTMLGKKIAVTAPADGIVEMYDKENGELKLRYLPKKIPLYSGVFGIVDAVNPVIGEVMIKTIVTEVLGLFGVGVERGGIIHILSGPNILIGKEQINPKLKARIVVGGALVFGDTLRRALEVGVGGLICGGLNARDFKSMSGKLDPMLRVGTYSGVTIMATEGFGARGIGDDIYAKIIGHNGRFAFLDGNSCRLWLPSVDPDSIMALRKVVLPITRIPAQSVETFSRQIQVGNIVRVIWPPYAGWQGEVVGIDGSPTRLPSGVITYSITLQTRLKKIKVPFPNIEIINEKS